MNNTKLNTQTKTDKTKPARTATDKIMGTPSFVTINGNTYSPKRLKVMEVHNLINDKMARTKRAQDSQIKLVKIQTAIQQNNLDSLGIKEEDAEAAINDLQDMLKDMAIEAGGAHNMWLIQACYDVTQDDLDGMEWEEYELAVQAIFEVNPSLGKSREMLVMNPFQMNPNG